MTIIEEFTQIVEKERQVKLIPFLKTLDKAQKKELIPALKKLHKYYSEFVPTSPGSTSYSGRGTNSQMEIIGIANFVCFNQKDFEANWNGGIVRKDIMDGILPWYCPDWFNNYINSQGGVKYEWYMELAEQGYVQSHAETIAKMLPQVIFKQKYPQYDYLPENLLKRKITLEEHIWYLFEHESSINWNDRYTNYKTGDSLWIKTFKDLVNDNKIDRNRLLKESLKAANKNYNQSLSGWFADLFIQLEPSKNELIELQDELLNGLNSQHSKIVNTSLKYLKGLASGPEFSTALFLDAAPTVLSSETKSAVASTLMILDKVAKNNPDLHEGICVIACQAFIHQDDALQVRTAKLIQKYGDVESELLQESLLTYHGSLFLEARGIMANFLENHNTAEIEPETEVHQPGQVATYAPIKTPKTFDEFIFLASQAFDQNEIYHFDLLPAAILKFQDEMTTENILKLAPAFQRAYKLLTSDWTSTIGYLDNMLAKFFMDYGQLLVQFYPKEAEPIRLLRATFLQKEEEKKAKNSNHTIWIKSGIKPWDIASGSTGYKPHKHILLNAFFLLERKLKLPLVSTPTHEPCYVSSLTLVERLIAYQQANVIPGNMDLQVAIARCIKINPEATLKLADEKLKGEYRHLISFLFGGEYSPNDSYKLKTAWLMAAITREQAAIDKRWFAFSPLADNYLTGEFEWLSRSQDYTTKQYDFNLRKDIDVPQTRKIIEIHFGQKLKQPSVFKNLIKKVLPDKNQPETSLFEFIDIKYKYSVSGEQNDIKRLICLTPHSPGLLIAHILNKVLRYPEETGENDKKLITYTLETLLSLNGNHGTMAHLLLATSLTSNDKTIKTYSAELWIKGVTESTIQSKRIGEIIGTHQQIEIAPIKRFTDILLSNMYQISPAHNHQLELMLTACITNMPAKPVNNTKKLLEIYAELLSVNKTNALNSPVTEKLALWESNDSLTKSIQKIKAQVDKKSL